MGAGLAPVKKDKSEKWILKPFTLHPSLFTYPISHCFDPDIDLRNSVHHGEF
jgi:hypothetical protein